MAKGFKIRKGVLKKYKGTDAHVVIPDSVTEIGEEAFYFNKSIVSVVIPEGVWKIGVDAFSDCENLASVTFPKTLRELRSNAFRSCDALTSIDLPESLESIGNNAFEFCYGLTSVRIPRGVRIICSGAFSDCRNLSSVIIEDGGVMRIGGMTFDRCPKLISVSIPDSVYEIGETAFDKDVTYICSEGSAAHRACLKEHRPFVFDYQYEAFGGLIPQGFERLSSPFAADEEKPYIFVSYSHIDRETVLEIMKGLYESGWRVWYDEGLTIGDSYDKTLEEHVKNCSAFLLFVTENSIASGYIRKNEVPWAKEFHKPIVKCIVNEGLDYEIDGGSVVATVTPAEIEPALETVGGLTKGERREAKGISVLFDPTVRGSEQTGRNAYCIYAKSSSAKGKTVLHEAKNSGCKIYDAVTEGESGFELEYSPCLVALIDRAFLADAHLTELLTEAYRSGADIAVCQLEEIEDADLPPELVGLHKLHWLNFSHGISAELNTKLAQYLRERGCGTATVLPGFEYKTTDRGIVIKRYTGMDPNPRIESEYGGVTVVEIADKAFENCIRLKSFVIPDGVTTIGREAFLRCTSLTSVILPDSMTEIGPEVFEYCSALTLVRLPNDITKIPWRMFRGCKDLASVEIPDSVTVIADNAFEFCGSLTSITLPNTLRRIGKGAFHKCTSLTEVKVRDTGKPVPEYEVSSRVSCFYEKDGPIIGYGAFSDCTALTSLTVPDGVCGIDDHAFHNCPKLDPIPGAW